MTDGGLDQLAAQGIAHLVIAAAAGPQLEPEVCRQTAAASTRPVRR